jgi:ATP-dependent DNA helicase RecG
MDTLLSLTMPLARVALVGHGRAVAMQRLELRTCGDLLFNFPRDYERPAPFGTIDTLRPNLDQAVVGTVVEVERRGSTDGRSTVGVLIEDSTGLLKLLFFNQPYRSDQMQRGTRVLVSGRPKLSGLAMQMVHPKVVLLAPDEPPPQAPILPIYSLTEGIRQSEMRTATKGVVESLSGSVQEVLPEPLRQVAGLMDIGTALREVHWPTSESALQAARKRFIFQELFVLQLALAMRRRRLTTDLHAPPLPITAAIDARIKQVFAFPLTGDQQRAIEEVSRDMGKQYPMNRLLQGDVGSGKTVVAQYAMLLAVANGHQSAMMAPTEILAQQHFHSLGKSLASSRVKIGCLTGSTTASERRELLRSLADGTTSIVVGTQALIGEDVRFHRLGLVVIDEQHKFGVAQRAKLRQHGIDPHSLVLSATPIPRTVSMTWFGDLELSTLKERPPGRGPLHTYLARDGWQSRWWQFVRQRLDEGRQAYVVAPRVSVDDESEATSAEQVYEQLAGGLLQGVRLGLLHGRMASADKAEALERFVQGRTQVLVATTVIEVGIDVPNATVMTIFGADRFGLAQLHQLRGRVTRGKHPGYVCLFADGVEDSREHERLKVLASTDDGFALAEADVRLRGPGDLLGTRQMGMPPLRIADPLRDIEVVEHARALARQWIDEDPDLQHADHLRLRTQVLRRYGDRLELGDIA